MKKMRRTDVQFKLVRDMQTNIKKIVNLDDLAAGHNKRKIIQQAKMLDPGKPSFTPKKGKTSVVMFVGLQGSGKTTTCTKYAYYHQKKGWKPALVCADDGCFSQQALQAAKAHSFCIRKRDEGCDDGVEREAEERPYKLPPQPEKPLPGDCCGSGCVRCVWNVYYAELEDYNIVKCKWLHEVGVGNHGQPEEPRNLKLIQRLDISIDVASALEYLHCGTIIHGDLKPSNVLLDDEMTALIGDFGLSEIISTVSSDVAQDQSNSVVIRGTIEFGMEDMVFALGDVYNFGTFLLEMFTGKRPTDDMFKDHLNLHNLVKNALPNRVMEIVDPYMLLEHNTRRWIKGCMLSVLRFGIACSMESPRDRMEMRSVIS
ncbi:unnamed protein product [Camellia sinensis]